MQSFLNIRRTAKIWPIMRMSPLYPYVGNSFFRPVVSASSGLALSTSASGIGRRRSMECHFLWVLGKVL